jgi:hypothetical protein
MMRETAESMRSGTPVDVVPISTREEPRSLPRRQVATAAALPMSPYRHLLRPLWSHGRIETELSERITKIPEAVPSDQQRGVPLRDARPGDRDGALPPNLSTGDRVGIPRLERPLEHEQFFRAEDPLGEHGRPNPAGLVGKAGGRG